MTETALRPETTVSTETTAGADYATLRTTVGWYRVEADLVRVSGDDRNDLLDRLLSKPADFVEPDTTREALALDAGGSPFAVVLHLELGDESWLLSRTPLAPGAFAAHLAGLGVEGDVTVETPEGFAAVAFEGPLAWRVAADHVDFDVSGLVLHSTTPVDLDGASTAHLARVGTTGEYGYLLLSDAPDAAEAAVSAGAAAAGGGPVGPEGLARVQSEAGTPYCSRGLAGLGVHEADLSWMVDWNHVGRFHGSDDLTPPGREAPRLTALVAAPGVRVADGTPVLAGGRPVGTTGWQSPSANPDEELLFALLDDPFWASGLVLTTTDTRGAEVALATASLPRVLARSTQNRIG